MVTTMQMCNAEIKYRPNTEVFCVSLLFVSGKYIASLNQSSSRGIENARESGHGESPSHFRDP